MIRKTIKYKEISNIETKLIENVGIEIVNKNHATIKIYSVYFPGASNSEINRRIYKTDLRKLLSTTGNFIFCGDYNSRHRNWGCIRANSWGNILNDMTTFFPISISFSSTPTYIPTRSSSSPSTLDILLSNVSYLLSPLTTLNDLNSDHMPVLFHIYSDVSREGRDQFNFNKADWRKYKSVLRSSFNHIPSSDSNFYHPTEIDHGIETFTNTLHDSVRQSVPFINKQTNCFILPFYILILIRIRNFYRKEWSRYRQMSDYVSMYSYNQTIRNQIQNFRNRQWSHKLMSLDKSSKPFWNITKILRNKKQNMPALKVGSDIKYTSKEKSDCLAVTFLQNHHTSDGLSTRAHIIAVEASVSQFNLQQHPTPPNEVITSNLVRLLIKDLKIRKATGFDMINNRMLKHLPAKGIEYLVSIFNPCLKLQYFPMSWKSAKVIPIQKPGKPFNNPNSYRPISLLSSISKLFEKIIKINIDKHLSGSNILPKEQFGFRRHHSTSHQVKRICNHVKLNFSHGFSTALVLLDVAKAFDTIWHDALIFKMMYYKFPPFLIKIIKSYLTSRSFRVLVDNELSDPMEIPSGVPQGTVLGPILFNIYMSDFPLISPAKYAAYADDVGIFFSHKLGHDIVTNLQCALNKLVQYYDKWKLKLNYDKTQYIFFTRKRKNCFLPSSNLTINGVDICWSENVKYLGIHLDRKLTFQYHITTIQNKVNLYIKILYPLINRKSSLSNFNKITILKVVFQSIILYGCPAWETCAISHVKKLQICQNKVLKMMLNLPRRYPTDLLHELSNTYKVADRISTITNKFRTSCEMSDNSLISSILDT